MSDKVVWFLAGAFIGVLVYQAFKQKEYSSGMPLTTGMGISGIPRAGRRKTEAERRKAHYMKHGTKALPPRGTAVRAKYL